MSREAENFYKMVYRTFLFFPFVQLLAFCFLLAKEKKYHQSQSKAEKVYDLASDGIPALSFQSPSIPIIAQDAINTLRTVNNLLYHVFPPMKVLATFLQKHAVIQSLDNVSDSIVPTN